MASYSVLTLGVLFIVPLLIQGGAARKHYGSQHEGGYLKGASGMAAFRNKASPSYEAINQWMLMKRDLLNITIDTDKIDEQPLTASELLLRMKLMAYVQKLVDKEAKKKAKEAKKAEKAQAKAALLGLSPAFYGIPPPVTVSPPVPIQTSVNLSGSEPLPPTGFWLYKKAEFLTKLFSALAEAASTLPGVTTEAPVNEEEESTGDTIAEYEEDVMDGLLAKRAVDSEEYKDNKYAKRVHLKASDAKILKRSHKKPKKHYRASNKFHSHKAS